ncbi:MAG: hypothetical protein HY644_07835 [Acidobacteria bacterium]|nr:hypothetical protein [Acidobacteriota bacterium]
MNLVKGEAQVVPKQRQSFDPILIPKAVSEAGFTAPEVVVTVDGTLIKGEEFPELNVPGLEHSFMLAGGKQAAVLGKRTDLTGKRVRISGKLHPSHGDALPGLTVENFQVAP